jgi:hypothetical protein
MQNINNFIDDFKNVYIKAMANFICLVSLSALTVWGIVQILNYPLVQIWIGVLSVTVDVYMQYVLAYGKWLWRTNIATNRAKAILVHFFSYLIYMLAYNFFFAVGFFMVEFDTKEDLTIQSSLVEQQKINRLKAIERDLIINAKYRDIESQTGFGTKSQKLKEEKERLEKEQLEIFESLKNIPEDNKIVYTNVFNAWAKVLQCSTSWLKIISFSVLVLTIQIILIWTSWDINPIRENQTKNNTLSTEKKELLTILDSFFEGKNGNGLTDVTPLNGVDIVSKRTGVSRDKCIYWRNYLSKLKVNGGMAFSIKQGVTYANYKKDFIRDYILSH